MQKGSADNPRGVDRRRHRVRTVRTPSFRDRCRTPDPDPRRWRLPMASAQAIARGEGFIPAVPAFFCVEEGYGQSPIVGAQSSWPCREVGAQRSTPDGLD
jgi:hypothetical protein